MDIVGVRFERLGMVRYVDAAGLDFEVGDIVLIETDSGVQEAEVIIAPRQFLFAEIDATNGTALGKVDPI